MLHSLRRCALVELTENSVANGVARVFGKVGHNEKEEGQASEASRISWSSWGCPICQPPGYATVSHETSVRDDLAEKYDDLFETSI